jgi:hypothetical protein
MEKQTSPRRRAKTTNATTNKRNALMFKLIPTTFTSRRIEGKIRSHTKR